jgi:hypothetical protein
MCLQLEDSVTTVMSSAAWSADTCARTVVVGHPYLFQPKQRVLLHAPQCLHDEHSVDHHVGTWAWNRIDTVIGRRVFLKEGIPSTFQRIRMFQLVRVMQPPMRFLPGRLRAQPWNGLYGGVVAVWADDTLEVSSPITTSGLGFVQDQLGWNSFDTIPARGFPDTVASRGKGRGACEANAWSWNDGGMAGYPHNGGGGGGGAAGNGGLGGQTSTAFSVVSQETTRAERSRLYHDRLLFGAAGGAGHGNDFDAGRGGRGGGIIIIRAQHLIFTPSGVLQSDGTNGHDAVHDGAGGGGSGGTILLDATTVSGSANLFTRGGHGGSTHTTMFPCGPGGGGGGGSILTTAKLPVGSRTSVDGGSAGSARAEHLQPEASDRGASAGGVGLLTMDVAPWQPIITQDQRAYLSSADSVVDFAGTTVLSSIGSVQTTWLDDVTPIAEDQVLTPPITEGRWFRARLTMKSGCVMFDSVYVRPSPQAQRLEFSIGELHGYAGDTIDVFLSIRCSTAFSREIEGTVFVSTHPSVLLPHDGRARVINGRTRLVVPFRLAPSTTSTFRREQLRAVLGDSASVQLQIDSITIRDRSVPTQRRHGRFYLDGICDATGTPRLFRPKTSLSLRGRQLTFTASELFVSDLLGRTLAQYDNPSRSQAHVTIGGHIRGLIFLTTIDQGVMSTTPIWVDEGAP